MTDLPADWGSLCILVFLLGMRHGLDADHLAAIDGLTRIGARRGGGWARYSGVLFSLGHGGAVPAIAALEGRKLMVGLSVIARIGLSYLGACRLAAPPAQRTETTT